MSLIKYGVIILFTLECIDNLFSIKYGEALTPELKEKLIKKQALQVAEIPEEYWHKVETIVYTDCNKDIMLVRIKSYQQLGLLYLIPEGAEFPKISNTT